MDRPTRPVPPPYSAAEHVAQTVALPDGEEDLQRLAAQGEQLSSTQDHDQPETTETSSERRPQQRTRSRLAVAGFTLWSLALLGGGTMLGWAGHRRFSDQPAPVVLDVVVDRPVVAGGGENSAAGTVPNVLGLLEEQARQVMTDAGLSPSSIVFETIPAAGEVGTVVNQDPPPGSLMGGAVKIYLGEATTMPELVALDLAQARTQLAQLGARPSVISRFDAAVREGVVIETNPKAGAPLTAEVQLVVGDAASSVFVTELSAIEQQCSTDQVTANAVDFDVALVCSPRSENVAATEYALNRMATAFSATLSHADDGGLGVPVTFTVYVDGVRAGAWTVAFGQSIPIEVPIQGALRLRLETQRAVQIESNDGVRAVWAEPRLLGGRESIDAMLESD